jgi:hypothetical protein
VVPCRDAETDKAFADYRQYLRPDQAPLLGATLPAHTNPHAHFYLTYHGRKLTELEADGLNQGASVLFVIGVVKWRDLSGTYETYFSRYLKRGDSGEYNWHVGGDNQKEIKLSSRSTLQAALVSSLYSRLSYP